MASKASVAPKERVNIVYRPAQSERQEEVELPLKLLVMGDFIGRRSPVPLEKRQPTNIDRDNFQEVMRGHRIQIDLAVTNRLQNGPELEIHLKIESLKDLEPDAIVEQVPELRRLLELRKAFQALKGPICNVPEFRKKIQELISSQESRQRLISEIGGADTKEERP